jgi:putative FmdB family regulatory protein
MPIYVYRCRECGEKFELLRSIHDNDAGAACPKCGRKNPQRLLASVFGQISRGESGSQRSPT